MFRGFLHRCLLEGSNGCGKLATRSGLGVITAGKLAGTTSARPSDDHAQRPHEQIMGSPGRTSESLPSNATRKFDAPAA
jgi:hypothetical protein